MTGVNLGFEKTPAPSTSLLLPVVKKNLPAGKLISKFDIPSDFGASIEIGTSVRFAAAGLEKPRGTTHPVEMIEMSATVRTTLIIFIWHLICIVMIWCVGS